SATVEGLTGLKIDGYIGLLIACYIIYSGIQLIREFVDELMGLRPNQEQIDMMTTYLSSVTEIVGYHDLLIHQYGPNKIFASVHIEIDDRWDLNRAHEATDEIEYTFRKQLGIDLVCHIDPVNLHDQKEQFIHQEIKDIIKSLSPDLKAHDIRTANHGTGDKILFDLVIPNKFHLTEEQVKTEIQVAITKKIGNYKADIRFDHTYLLL
ncbi:cation diffusion facilitator family transporter, partial [Vagococcus salmoninarum]